MTLRVPALILLVLIPAPAGAGDWQEPERRPAGPSVGGRLVWDLDDELDLLGDLWAELPFRVAPGDEVVFSLDTRTAIEKADSDFTFDVRDLEYALELGWRGDRIAGGERRFSLFVGQRGKELVDERGQSWVRYLAAGLESRRITDRAPERGERDAGTPRLEWRVAGGPVFEEREVRAAFVLRGAARYRLRGFGRPSGLALDADLELDGLLHAGRFAADIAGGPRLSFDLDGDRQASLFLHYQRSRNPLGIGHSALLAGFEYAEGPGGRGRRGPPDVRGTLAAGGGDDGRASGRLLLHFSSPAFAGRTRFAIAVDANLLTAEDTDDLYYLYDFGLERPVGEHPAGFYFYHRSNHQLTEPNDTVTSINVLELGIETAGWNRSGTRVAGGRPLEARARLGYLLDSAFGEERRWHARGGLRWYPPLRRAPAAPYLQLEAEAGDVEREAVALGLAVGAGVEVQLEYRSDDQLFSRDRTVVLLTTRYGF